MIRLLFFIFLIIVSVYIIRYLLKNSLSGIRSERGDPELEELVQDPFCQTYIPKRSALKKRIGGRDYYFCNSECLKKFIKNEKS